MERSGVGPKSSSRYRFTPKFIYTELFLYTSQIYIFLGNKRNFWGRASELDIYLVVWVNKVCQFIW